MTQADLSRESGVTEQIIGGIRQPRDRNRSTLVALSAALRCRHDFLMDVWGRKADPREPSPAEAAFFENLLHSKVDPLKAEIVTLRDIIHEINGKVTMLLDRQREE